MGVPDVQRSFLWPWAGKPAPCLQSGAPSAILNFPCGTCDRTYCW